MQVAIGGIIFDHHFESVLLIERDIPRLHRFEITRTTLCIGSTQDRLDECASYSLALTRPINAEEERVE